MRPSQLVLALALLSANAHAQWQLQDAHTAADLRGIDNVGGGVAWASGTNGTVLRTEDAGFVWQLCTIPPGAEHLDFRGIQAFDNNTAIVMSSGKGDLSRLYKTTDGCQTWKLVFTNPDPDGFWDAVKARVSAAEPDSTCNRNSAIISGAILGDPTIHKSNQWDTTKALSFYLGEFTAGVTCPEQKLKPSASSIFSIAPGEGAFAASNSVLFQPEPNMYWLAVRGRLIQYKGGHSGPDQYAATSQCDLAVHVGSSSDSSGEFSLAIRPASFRGSKRTKSSSSFSPGKPHCFGADMVAVGGDYKLPAESAGTASYTAGTDAFKPAQTPPHGYRSAVAYDTTTDTWITVGPNGTDISTDDGRNWRPLKPNLQAGDPPDADQHWNALSLPYVVGPHGRIATLRPDALPSTTHSIPKR